MNTTFKIRKATQVDLPEIIGLLMDDELGKKRETAIEGEIAQGYLEAFEDIKKDSNAMLLAGEIDGKVVATAQVNYLAYLTYQGGKRAQIEAVRVHKDYRNQGIGKVLIKHIVEEAKANNCHMVQLTTNKARIQAKRFYERLGFVNSHEGMKLMV